VALARNVGVIIESQEPGLERARSLFPTQEVIAMKGCLEVKRAMLSNPVEVHTGLTMIDFDTARRLADKKAREISADPMLLAWYDRKAGMYSPDPVCCSYDKPGWLVYAEARGGTIAVDVNDEEYVFMYYPGI